MKDTMTYMIMTMNQLKNRSLKNILKIITITTTIMTMTMTMTTTTTMTTIMITVNKSLLKNIFKPCSTVMMPTKIKFQPNNSCSRLFKLKLDLIPKQLLKLKAQSDLYSKNSILIKTGSTLTNSQKWLKMPQQVRKNYDKKCMSDLDIDKKYKMQHTIFIQNIIMKKQPNLPTLGSTSRKHSQSKDSVKLIETKINQHENQISRNQKFIISIANDFRLIKQQLTVKQKQTEELSEMYRKLIEQNQKLTKGSKEMKLSISRLEKTVQEKDRQINQVRPDQNENKLNEKQQQINQLKDHITGQNKKIKVLQHNNQQILKEHDKMKQELTRLKKAYQDQLKMKSSSEEEKNRNLNQIIDKLMLDKEQLNKQIKQNEAQMKKVKESLKDRDRIVRENKKLEQDLKHQKITNEKLVQENKKRRQRINELEEQKKKLELLIAAQNSSLAKIKTLQQQQKVLKQKNYQNDEKIRSLNNQIRELASEKQMKKKLEAKLKKIIKSKGQISKILEQLKSSIKCQYCSKIAEKPVTCIPCGHSFCLECKKGYEKQCKKCTNVKREAVYRNELLDQIISSFDKIKQVSQILQLTQ